MSDAMTMLPVTADELDDTDNDDQDVVRPPANETIEARSARIERERIMIEEAEEDFRQGRFIPDHEVDEWLDCLIRGEPVRIPGRD